MCRGLSKRGIQAKVHVARKGHRQASHLSLACKAALVVAEEPFCAPFTQGLAALCNSPSLQCPVWVVDCDSVIPMCHVPASATHRAYAYEAAVKSHMQRYCTSKWVDQSLNEDAAEATAGLRLKLPFTPVDLEA